MAYPLTLAYCDQGRQERRREGRERVFLFACFNLYLLVPSMFGCSFSLVFKWMLYFATVHNIQVMHM